MKKSGKPLTGAQKRKLKRDQKEKEENVQKELVADVERLRLGPTDLWKLITDWPDIFETHRRLNYKRGLVFTSYLRYLPWSWPGKDIHGVRGYVTQTGRYLR